MCHPMALKKINSCFYMVGKEGSSWIYGMCDMELSVGLVLVTPFLMVILFETSISWWESFRVEQKHHIFSIEWIL
jgi:hypothetical protein